ncbi:hypothetical protein KKA47_07370 [bacterium]|nr:hypothetical protein [bacterium]
MKNFEEIISRLSDNDVKFILIGGYAAIIHGSTLVTNDLDIVIPFEKENLKKLLIALEGSNPTHQENKKPLIKTADELSHFKNLYLNTDIGPIDMLGKIPELGDYKELLSRSIEIDLFGRKCRILDIETLIKAKYNMGRTKDKITVIELRAIQEKLNK